MSRISVFVRILAGGYLVYLGYGLARHPMENGDPNYLIYMAIGIIFIVGGAAIFINGMLHMIRHDYDDRLQSEDKILDEDERAQEATEDKDADVVKEIPVSEEEEEKPGDETKPEEEAKESDDADRDGV